MNIDLTERIILAAKGNLPFTLNREEIAELAELFASKPSDQFTDLRGEIEVAAKELTGQAKLTMEQTKYVASLI